MSPVRKLLSQASTPVIRLLRWSWLLGGIAVVGMALTFAVLYHAHARIEAYQHPVAAEQRLERIAIVAVALELLLAVLVMDRLGRRVLMQAMLAARREEELRALVDTSPLAIIVTGVDSRVLDWNPAAERIFGYSRADVLHQPLPIVAPDRVAEFDAITAEVLAGGSLSDHGTQCRRHDGVLVDVSLSTTAMRNAVGKPASIVGIYADVTARVQLEAEFRQAQKMEAVGRLAGGVAHDFNNLLTVITSFSSMILADADAGAPWRDDVREIKLAADRAARLTRQLLAFSRRQVLRPQVVDLNATIEDLEKMLRRLIGEDVALETRLAPDLWPVRVDPGQIEQVVMNLVVNARDAMTDGGLLRITTGNEAVSPSLANAHGGCAGAGEYVCLVVTDTGGGMSPEVRSHIFEPFFTTKGPGKGTGLGLSTIYGIVQQSDGFIQVESAPGVGSTFRIFLPRSAADFAGTLAPAAPVAGPDNARTVLLVEDDAPVRAAIRAMLQRGGYEVIEAGGGEEALRILERDGASIHVVLTDIVMPRVGGRELGRHVLAHWPALPVIYMTGYAADTAQGHWALERDAVVLDKPFTAEPLMAALKVALGRPAAALGRPAAALGRPAA